MDGAVGCLETEEGAAHLLFVRSGAAELRVEGRRFVLDPSQVAVLPPGIAYRFRHRPCRGGVCVTTLQVAQDLLRSRPRSGPSQSRSLSPAILAADSLDVAYALHVLLALTRSQRASCGAAFVRGGGRGHVVVAGVVEKTFGSAGDRAAAPRQVSELARRARELLVHRASDRVSLAAIADDLCCSRFHLCRVFKAELGLTTHQYLQRVRISEALYRLGDGEGDLLGLALELGFSSHSHFTSVFHRLVGMPPSKVWARTR